MKYSISLKNIFSGSLAVGCITAASVLAGCGNVEVGNEVTGGKKVGEGGFTANPIVIPIHGYTGAYENLRPLCDKIEGLYHGGSYINTLVPENRGNRSSTDSIEDQAMFVYNDIKEALLGIYQTYGKEYDGKIPVNLLTISQGTQLGMVLRYILHQNGFDTMFDFRMFGINSVFHGCSLVDNALISKNLFIGLVAPVFINSIPGLAGLKREACEARLSMVSKLFDKRTCHLVASTTKNPGNLLTQFGMGALVGFSAQILDEESDGLLSVVNQLGTSQKLIKPATSLIEGDHSHVAIHCWDKDKDAPYLEKVFEKYLELHFQ